VHRPFRLRRFTFVTSAIAALLLVGGCATTPPSEPLCVLSAAAMPESWRPSAELRETLGAQPWSPNEAKDARHAVRSGFDELQSFFAKKPEAVMDLGTDAVEVAIDVSYAASNMPALQAAARGLARRNLAPLLAPFSARDPGSIGCGEFSSLLALAIYANALLPAGDPRTHRMITLTNAGAHACRSLNGAIGYDYRDRLHAGATTGEIWDLVMWSITLTDAQTIPNLDLPAGASALPPALWRFLGSYPLVAASDFTDRARNPKFYDTAYLVTHIAYLPTGYGRYPIYIEDAPWLYRFLRENFYSVLRMGELDLVAEFVDLFRQYGCTEENDMQLRDGTRYLLKLFHQAGNRWMAYREPNEPADTGAYNEVHKAWTGISAVRVRVPDPVLPGTYGAVVRGWLGYPR
jgi:hypothetical protein